MIRPFLSIIIPCYNCEFYLNKTLISVMNQTCKDFELIFIDDGSTDNSLKVAKDILEQSNVIYKVISHSNCGASRTRNIGLQHCKGDYIYFLDADDTINDDMVASVKEASNLEYDMVIFKYRGWSGTSNINIGNGIITGSDLIKDFSLGNSDIHMCSFIVKKKIIDKFQVTFTEGVKYGEDVEFFLKLIYHSKNIRLLDKVLFNYVYREGSAVNTYNESRLDSLDSAVRIYDYIVNKNKDLKYYLSFFILMKIDQNINSYLKLNQIKDNNTKNVLFNKIKIVSKIKLSLKQVIVLGNLTRILKNILKIILIKYFLFAYITLKEKFKK